MNGDWNERNVGKPIIVKFESWKFSEMIKKMITDNLKFKNGNVYVSQMYSKKTNDRQYKARQYRKELFTTDPNQNIFIKYPADVMGKKKGTEDKYKLLKSF